MRLCCSAEATSTGCSHQGTDWDRWRGRWQGTQLGSQQHHEWGQRPGPHGGRQQRAWGGRPHHGRWRVAQPSGSLTCLPVCPGCVALCVWEWSERMLGSRACGTGLGAVPSLVADNCSPGTAWNWTALWGSDRSRSLCAGAVARCVCEASVWVSRAWRVGFVAVTFLLVTVILDCLRITSSGGGGVACFEGWGWG